MERFPLESSGTAFQPERRNDYVERFYKNRPETRASIGVPLERFAGTDDQKEAVPFHSIT
jgi:hypothetical protein